MTHLKFKDYDRGNVRAYFKSAHVWYCFQPNFGLQLLVCSRDGEPSHPVTKLDNLTFSGFDMAEWKFNDIHEYFRDCLSDGDICRKMNTLWGG